MSEAPSKSGELPSWIRPCVRTIRMVSELHRMGFQRLRMFPYEYPLAWRLCIAPRDACHARNGAYVPGSAMETYSERFAHGPEAATRTRLVTYSSASEREYFGWTDARTDSARDLANKFIVRFPSAAEAGRGRDWEYAGWLDELMSELERSPRLPFVMAEYFEPEPLGLRALPIRVYDAESAISLDFPLPPGGGYDRDD
jgi:hypothetical protein